jgi:hypothetical protein
MVFRNIELGKFTGIFSPLPLSFCFIYVYPVILLIGYNPRIKFRAKDSEGVTDVINLDVPHWLYGFSKIMDSERLRRVSPFGE